MKQGLKQTPPKDMQADMKSIQSEQRNSKKKKDQDKLKLTQKRGTTEQYEQNSQALTVVARGKASCHDAQAKKKSALQEKLVLSVISRILCLL